MRRCLGSDLGQGLFCDSRLPMYRGVWRNIEEQQTIWDQGNAAPMELRIVSGGVSRPDEVSAKVTVELGRQHLPAILLGDKRPLGRRGAEI